MVSRFDLWYHGGMEIQSDRRRFAALAHEHGARFVVLYGSYANGRFDMESDVDVAVYFEPDRVPEGFTRYEEIVEQLGSVFRTDASKIDFVVLNRANILLRHEITANGKLFFGDEDDYAQYQAFAFRDYCDARPLFALEDFLIRKRQDLIRHAAATASS